MLNAVMGGDYTVREAVRFPAQPASAFCRKRLYSGGAMSHFQTGDDMYSEPIKVTDAAFDKSVLKSELPVVVDFWAPWCGPCRMVAPILDKLAKEFEGKLVIAKVNTDEDGMYAQQYGVRGIPTMLFVHNGQEVHRQVGALPEPMLREVFTQFVDAVAEAA
jgi:thioredoxin 1